MAERGPETLRYGPMKPVGLHDPHRDERPYAVVQLRQDNALGTLYNIVGFQTKLKHGEQARIFRTIPGLENAAFARLGGLLRSEEHTSELQSLMRISYAVFCLKKTTRQRHRHLTNQTHNNNTQHCNTSLNTNST